MEFDREDGERSACEMLKIEEAEDEEAAPVLLRCRALLRARPLPRAADAPAPRDAGATRAQRERLQQPRPPAHGGGMAECHPR